jgi:phage terminase small subunit
MAWHDGLTGKQRIFVQEYTRTLNATEAAKRAGYSTRSAAEIGWENLRKPKSVAAVEAAMTELYSGDDLTQDTVIAGLLKEARYAMSDSARVRCDCAPTIESGERVERMYGVE